MYIYIDAYAHNVCTCIYIAHVYIYMLYIYIYIDRESMCICMYIHSLYTYVRRDHEELAPPRGRASRLNLGALRVTK